MNNLFCTTVVLSCLALSPGLADDTIEHDLSEYAAKNGQENLTLNLDLLGVKIVEERTGFRVSVVDLNAVKGLARLNRCRSLYVPLTGVVYRFDEDFNLRPLRAIYAAPIFNKSDRTVDELKVTLTKSGVGSICSKSTD